MPDNIIGFLTYVGISIPPFWLSMVLIIIFLLKLQILPSSGMYSIGIQSTADLIKHLILPSIVLSLNNMAVFTRYIRSNTISQLEEDYVLTAMSKGTSKTKILFRHVLKTVCFQLLHLLALILRDWFVVLSLLKAYLHGQELEEWQWMQPMEEIIL